MATSDVIALVIDRRVIAKLLGAPCPLIRPAGDADRAAADDPGDLSDGGTNRSGGG